MAYAENALPNSSSRHPRNDGISTGPPMYRQYCQVPAPMFCAASRQAGRSPSNAGRMMSTISGIWKYR